MVEAGYFSDMALYRAVDGFLVQFGINSQHKDYERWCVGEGATIEDDPFFNMDRTFPQLQGPLRTGFISFAGRAPTIRACEVFVSLLPDNLQGIHEMGTQSWETPVAQVVEGLEEVVMAWNRSYGDVPPFGKVRHHTTHYMYDSTRCN